MEPLERWSRGQPGAFCYFDDTPVRNPALHERELNRHMVEIYVRQNNVDQALRALKKKLQNEGILREMKSRKHYEKPSEKRVREQAEALRRARKLARKRAQIEGLIPSKKKRRR